MSGKQEPMTPRLSSARLTGLSICTWSSQWTQLITGCLCSCVLWAGLDAGWERGPATTACQWPGQDVIRADYDDKHVLPSYITDTRHIIYPRFTPHTRLLLGVDSSLFHSVVWLMYTYMTHVHHYLTHVYKTPVYYYVTPVAAVGPTLIFDP